jgi:hypothetical protein
VSEPTNGGNTSLRNVSTLVILHGVRTQKTVVEGSNKHSLVLLAGNLLGLLFKPEDGIRMFLRNVEISTILHGVRTHKITLFTITAVRTSDPTFELFKSKEFPGRRTVWPCKAR